MLEEKMYRPSLVSMAVIFFGFLLTSTGWIAWNYFVQEYMTRDTANFVTMVAGYAMQALGIGLFSIILRYKPSAAGISLPVLVLLLGVVIGCGFSFIPSGIDETVNVEMSRLVYIFSLVAAGFVADRSREKGAICALTVLVFPFVMLSLREATIPAVMFWLLSYFAFGFYSVYRVILFSDPNILYLSGFGLMIGRIGDASGEAISLALYERPVIHVGAAAVLSVAAIFVFFRVYHDLYIKGAGAAEIEKERTLYAESLLHMAASGSMDPGPGTGPENSRAGAEADREGVRQQWAEEAEQQPGREDGFFQFSARYELSPREREIFRLILSEKTNGEIADKLFISENTVKFHVRNILKKTGCKNRNELVMAYASQL